MLRSSLRSLPAQVLPWEGLSLMEFLKLCESPIEERLGFALAFASWPGLASDSITRQHDFHQIGSLLGSVLRAIEFGNGLTGNDILEPVVERRLDRLIGTVRIVPQVTLLRYRVDFLVAARLMVVNRDVTWLIVECDGAEFHTSAAQRERDRQRDFEIQAKLGIPTMRFTGSDIYRQEKRCAEAVVDTMLRLHIASYERVAA